MDKPENEKASQINGSKNLEPHTCMLCVDTIVFLGKHLVREHGLEGSVMKYAGNFFFTSEEMVRMGNINQAE